MKLPLTIRLDNQDVIAAVTREALSKVVDDVSSYKYRCAYAFESEGNEIRCDVTIVELEKTK